MELKQEFSKKFMGENPFEDYWAEWNPEELAEIWQWFESKISDAKVEVEVGTTLMMDKILEDINEIDNLPDDIYDSIADIFKKYGY